MSEFQDARIVRCEVCNRSYASCEGPLCDCDANEYCDCCGERIVNIQAGDEGMTYCPCCGLTEH